MIKRNKNLMRAIAMVMTAALLLASLPCAALADGFTAMVGAKSMYVVANVYGRTVYGALPRYTVLNVTNYANGIAQFNLNGFTAYARLADLINLDLIGEQAVTTTSTYAFAQPNIRSASVGVSAGTLVRVLFSANGVSLVEKDGALAFMPAGHLLTQSQFASGSMQTTPNIPQPAAPQVPTFAAAYQSGKFNNEQLCFLFLTQVMGYNAAAAAGVLANINAESGFKTAINGDGGTSYGLCQWHASRKTRLITYCAQYGLDVNSLIGQLMYLMYELETYYPAVHRYLKGVSNTAQGAYDAGYYFCYNYEAPANKASKSVTRGNSAKSTYFSRYAAI